MKDLKDKAPQNEIMELLSKYRDLWGGRLVTIEATHHTNNLKESIRSNREQPYSAGRQSWELFCEHVDMPLEPG